MRERFVEAGPALSRCSCIGPSASGIPLYGVWAGCPFSPDTPCVREFSRNGW